LKSAPLRNAAGLLRSEYWLLLEAVASLHSANVPLPEAGLFYWYYVRRFAKQSRYAERKAACFAKRGPTQRETFAAKIRL
jgi:hypothetical protein